MLDIVPTGEVWAHADHRFALGYWHWAFLAQPAPGPERLINADPEYFFFQGQYRGAASRVMKRPCTAASHRPCSISLWGTVGCHRRAGSTVERCGMSGRLI